MHFNNFSDPIFHSSASERSPQPLATPIRCKNARRVEWKQREIPEQPNEDSKLATTLTLLSNPPTPPPRLETRHLCAHEIWPQQPRDPMQPSHLTQPTQPSQPKSNSLCGSSFVGTLYILGVGLAFGIWRHNISRRCVKLKRSGQRDLIFKHLRTGDWVAI